MSERPPTTGKSLFCHIDTADLQVGFFIFDDLRYTMYSISMSSTEKTVGCVDTATEILGDKWTPRLLRFFINNEVVRFCQLQDLVGGINPRTLSARLTSLEEQGVIEKLTSDHSSRCEYVMTQKGHDLLPILEGMEVWSTKYSDK